MEPKRRYRAGKMPKQATKAESGQNVPPVAAQEIDGPPIHPTTVIGFADNYGVQQWIYAHVIPRRTLKDRLARDEALKDNDADRFMRLVMVIGKAEELFADKESALAWLNEGKPHFDGKSPLEASANVYGFVELLERMNQIEHGMVA